MWNAAMEQILRDKWDGEGLAAPDIARELTALAGQPVTKSMVVCKARRLNLKSRRRGIRAYKRKRHAPRTPFRGFKGEGFYSPLPPTPEVVYADDVVRVSFLDREPGQCGWPIGDPLLPGFGCCGDKTAKGEIYCPRHRHRSLEPIVDATPATPRSVDVASSPPPRNPSTSASSVDVTSTRTTGEGVASTENGCTSGFAIREQLESCNAAASSNRNLTIGRQQDVLQNGETHVGADALKL
ncbi:GcrA family cell cycle regulator [Hyphomicrobium sp.]|uniref:GcrA family cell cycle regulator n=1 Tax=Hyphomicrobium sp. TaxID=82 RepID=UPI0039E53B34